MVQGPIPQDITKYKTKFIATLSLRECIWGGAGIVYTALIYFFLDEEKYGGFKTPIMVIGAALLFLIGFLKIYDQPIEKILPELIFDNFIVPANRHKDMNYKEFEKYHDTLYWIKTEENSSSEQKGKGKKAKKKSVSKPRVKIRPSDSFPPIR